MWAPSKVPREQPVQRVPLGLLVHKDQRGQLDHKVRPVLMAPRDLQDRQAPRGPLANKGQQDPQAHKERPVPLARREM